MMMLYVSCANAAAAEHDVCCCGRSCCGATGAEAGRKTTRCFSLLEDLSHRHMNEGPAISFQRNLLIVCEQRHYCISATLMITIPAACRIQHVRPYRSSGLRKYDG